MKLHISDACPTWSGVEALAGIGTVWKSQGFPTWVCWPKQAATFSSSTDVQLCTRGRYFHCNITCFADPVNWNGYASMKEQGASSSLISIKLNLQSVHLALYVEESFWYPHLNPKSSHLPSSPVFIHSLLGGHWHSLESTATLLLCHRLLWAHPATQSLRKSQRLR